MALVKVAEFKGINLNNLVLEDDVLKSFGKLDPMEITKLITILGTLNEYGLSHDHFGKRIERLKGKYSKITELKVKSLAKKEWRFLVTPTKWDKTEEAKYAILHSFLKQSKTIKNSDKEKAYLIAKREGFL